MYCTVQQMILYCMGMLQNDTCLPDSATTQVCHKKVQSLAQDERSHGGDFITGGSPCVAMVVFIDQKKFENNAKVLNNHWRCDLWEEWWRVKNDLVRSQLQIKHRTVHLLAACFIHLAVASLPQLPAPTSGRRKRMPLICCMTNCSGEDFNCDTWTS